MSVTASLAQPTHAFSSETNDTRFAAQQVVGSRAAPRWFQVEKSGNRVPGKLGVSAARGAYHHDLSVVLDSQRPCSVNASGETREHDAISAERVSRVPSSRKLAKTQIPAARSDDDRDPAEFLSEALQRSTRGVAGPDEPV
jgi:hypothetical protein